MNTKPGEQTAYDGFPTGDFYGEWLDDRIANPRDDVITRLITTEFDDEQGVRRTLTRDEALVYLAVIAGAGNHTTNRLISWTAKVLADNPDARRELVADPSLIPNAIEETLRYEPSSTQIARWVANDVEIHGQIVPRGSAFLCCAGSAGPRRAGVRGRRPLRHPPQDRPPPHVRVRAALLPGRVAGPPRGSGRARRAAQALPRVGRRPRAERDGLRCRACAATRTCRSSCRNAGSGPADPFGRPVLAGVSPPAARRRGRCGRAAPRSGRG